MNYCSIPASVTAAAYAIAQSFSTDELALLAALFTQLGDTIASILICKQLEEKCRDSKSQSQTSQSTEQSETNLLTDALLLERF